MNVRAKKVIVIAMDDRVLYLGDTALNGAAAYLAGVMSYYSLDFDYLASDKKFNDSLLGNSYSAVIISDYPAGNFSPEQLVTIAERVNAGVGLLMMGGWESFTGAAGEYNNTILKDVLPVVMQDSDDRVNCSAPCLIEKLCEHKIIDSLPFDKESPTIGGFNRLQSKPDGITILSARPFKASRIGTNFVFTPSEEADPLLVIGSYGKGRTCAFASDPAPHWVGGLVDWGDSRIQAQAPHADAIEVGNWYAKLLVNIINWTVGSF